MKYRIILGLMILVLLSATVFAAHTTTITVTPNPTYSNTSTVFSISVSNTSGSSIATVRIQKPDLFGSVTCGAVPNAFWALAGSDSNYCRYYTTEGAIVSGDTNVFTLTSLTPVIGVYDWNIYTEDTVDSKTYKYPTTTIEAASPVFTGTTTATDQNVTGTDRNYVALDTNFNSPVASDADEDLNILSCEFSFDAGFSWFKSVDYPTVINYNADTNKCWAVLSNFAGAAVDDLQIGFRISDNGAADALSTQRTWWLDNNAPIGSSLITEFDSRTHINLTLTDAATNTGDGVGFKTMQYRLEGTAWAVGSSALSLDYISPTQTVGAHTLYYWVTDNFDNNSGIREIDFNIRGTAPSITGRTTATRQYVVAGDRNYYDFNVRWLSGTVTDVDGDLNELSCQASYNDGYTWSNTVPTVDYNTDVNKCQVNLNYEWGNTGYSQIKFRVSDDSNLTTTSPDANWYLDNTAPTTVGTFNNINVITLTATDSGTPSANGVGVKRIYYAVDGGAWTSVAASTANVTVTGVGSHHIYFYSTDNFDNNESYGNLSGDVWDKPFTVAEMSPGSPYCNLTMLMMLILVAAAIVGVLGLAYTGNLNIQTATAATIALVTFLVILIITGQVNAVMCV